MAKIKLASLIIVFLAGILLNFGLAGSAQAAFNCYVGTTCDAGGTPVFRVSATTNAHAEKVSVTPQTGGYSNICCSATGVTLGTSCSGNHDVILRTYGDTNAHVEKNTQLNTGYSDVCLSASDGPTIDCSYANDCSALAGGDYNCVASISGDTNAHVGSCSDIAPYTKICCRAAIAIKVTTKAADNIVGSSVRLNGTLDNNGGVDCTVSFGWGDVNSSETTVSVPGLKTTGDNFFSDINVPTKGKLYHFKAKAQNSVPLTGEGSDLTFFILPDAPVWVSAVPAGYDKVNLTWTKGTGATDTFILRKGGGGCSADRNDGSFVCGSTNGLVSGTSCQDNAGLSENTTYCYTAWSRALDETVAEYSSGVQISATTLPKIVVTTNSEDPDYTKGTSARIRGELNNQGGALCTTWFNWGDSAVSEHHEGYLYNQPTGANFAFDLLTLAKGVAYHFQAAASNAYMSAVGEERIFITVPDAPTGLAATAINYGLVNLSWTGNGAGAKSTIVIRQKDACPQNRGDGTQACEVLVPGKSCSDIGVVESASYCYRAFSKASEEGLESYSVGSNETWASTPAAPVFNFTITLSSYSASINPGGSVSNVRATINLTEGATQEINFSATGLPPGVAASFSPVKCTPSGSPTATCYSIMSIPTFATTPAGNYSVYVHGIGGGREVTSEVFNLTISISGAPVAPPTVVTGVADLRTTTSARLNGNLTNTGGAPCLVWFEWGEDPNNLDQSSYASAQNMSGVGTFSYQIPANTLSPYNTYHFRAMAKNGASW